LSKSFPPYISKNIFGRKTRFRSAKNVVDELSLLKDKYKIDGFFILDDTFTINKVYVLNICEELKPRKIDLIWGCETRPNLVNKDLLAEMEKAGCIQIDFGVESGSQKVLDNLQKDITPSQSIKAFSICRELGIRTFANFMINNPEETWEDIEKTK